MEEQSRYEGEQASRPDDANGAEHGGWPGDASHLTRSGIETPVEEDEDEGDRSESIGEVIVLERQASQSFRPGEHPEAQEGEEHRDPYSFRSAAEKRAAKEERADDGQ